MSGGYTHVTLTQLAIEEACFRREGLLHDDAKHALGNWKKFCIVGAVAPDYPYLDVTESDSCAWADVMHKGHAVELLRNGVAKDTRYGGCQCASKVYGLAVRFCHPCRNRRHHTSRSQPESGSLRAK